MMNAIVITAAASSCNSGLYSTGRMLYALALKTQAPARFGVLNRAHVPATAVNVSAGVMLIGVVLNYLVPEDVFTWVTSIALVGTLWTWVMIMLAHRNYRICVKQGRASAVSYRMPGAPIVNWAVIAFLIAVGALLWLTPGTRVALYVAPAWFALLGVGYYMSASRTGKHGPLTIGQVDIEQ
jgi:AAT family amino acid transporter/D-serine/D-alanine/glycine transporter